MIALKKNVYIDGAMGHLRSHPDPLRTIHKLKMSIKLSQPGESLAKQREELEKEMLKYDEKHVKTQARGTQYKSVEVFDDVLDVFQQVDFPEADLPGVGRAAKTVKSGKDAIVEGAKKANKWVMKGADALLGDRTIARTRAEGHMELKELRDEVDRQGGPRKMVEVGYEYSQIASDGTPLSKR